MRICLLLAFFFQSYFLSAQLVRGPYLQILTPNGITIRWRTAQNEDSRVLFGNTFNNLTSIKDNNTATKEHEIRLSNLLPNTKYYYAIGSTTRLLQNGADNYFITAPEVGSTQKVRFLALGDCGYHTTTQDSVKDQFLKYAVNKPFDMTLLMGDNAYISGFDDEYQRGFFDAYQGNILKNTVLYPATGNHEYANNGDLQKSHQIAYFDIFTLPQNAEAGGVPSGSEAYYSYDYANIHFIALDSYIKENDKRFYDTLSLQAEWLKKDLAATKQPWKIVYWHHPPYTKGSYDSDTVEELYLIRQNLLRILERNGVDLVLCGHSHVYERSTLLRSQYGTSETYRPKLHSLGQSSSGRYDGSASSCPFIKDKKGTVYVVAGTGAIIVPSRRQSSFPHKVMTYSNIDTGGSVIVEVEDNRLDAKWLCQDGVVRDQFTLMKNVKKTWEIKINKGENLTLNASWIGDYSWAGGEKQNKLTLKISIHLPFILYRTHKNAWLTLSLFQ